MPKFIEVICIVQMENLETKDVVETKVKRLINLDHIIDIGHIPDRPEFAIATTTELNEDGLNVYFRLDHSYDEMKRMLGVNHE